MKLVFSTEQVLLPRSPKGKDFVEETLDIVNAIRKEHPEYETFWYGLQLTARPSGAAILTIKVCDPNAMGTWDTFKVFLWILAFSLFIFALTYL